MSGLSDRDKLIATVIEAVDMWDGGYNVEREKYIREALERLPSAEITGKWIPVSERLPNDDTFVLIWRNGGVEIGIYEKDHWEWLAESMSDYWTEVTDVLAWMPLPKPYKE